MNKTILYIFSCLFAFTSIVHAQKIPKQQYFTGEFNYLYSKISDNLKNDSLNILPLLRRADSLSVLETENAKLAYLWGQYYYHKQYPYRAISYYKSIEPYYKKKKDSSMLIEIRINEAKAYTLSAEFQKAQKILFDILKYKNLSTHNKAEIFYLLSRIYSNFKIYVQAEIYANWAIIQANKINDNKIRLRSMVQKGYILYLKQKSNSGMNYYLEAIKIANKFKLYTELPAIYNTLAINYYEQGHKDSCLLYLKKGLKKAQKYSNHNKMAVINGNLGYLYLLEGKSQKALHYLLISKRYSENYDIRKQLIVVYDNLSMVYARIGKYPKAYKYSQKYKLLLNSVYSDNVKNTLSEMSAKYETEKKNKEIELLNKRRIIQKNRLQKQIIIIYSGLLIGVLVLMLLFILYRKNKFKTKTNKSLKHKNEEIITQKEEILAQKEELEQVTEHLEQLSLAVQYTTNAVLIFNAQLELIWANSAFERLYGFKLYKLLNKKLLYNYVRAKETPEIDSYIERMIQTKKSVSITSQRKDSLGNKLWIQSTMSPYFDKQANLNRIIIVESDISSIKRAQQKIQYQNKSITDSLNYAKKIQKNILPSEKKINLLFDSFVIYRPQEIVSGDFFWIHQTEALKNTWTSYVAMVDCTGHGVPGAFMSIIANSLLNRAIIEKKLYKPNSILIHLKKEFGKIFSHQQPDGFDIAICRIDKLKDNYMIYYCGAKIPLLYSESTNDKFIKIKADRVSIDTLTENKNSDFKLHRLSLNAGAELILSSDGIIDQANNERKRFGSRQLIDILDKNRAENLDKQKKEIDNALDNWLDNQGQRDDISLWGVKLR